MTNTSVHGSGSGPRPTHQSGMLQNIATYDLSSMYNSLKVQCVLFDEICANATMPCLNSPASVSCTWRGCISRRWQSSSWSPKPCRWCTATRVLIIWPHRGRSSTSLVCVSCRRDRELQVTGQLRPRLLSLSTQSSHTDDWTARCLKTMF